MTRKRINTNTGRQTVVIVTFISCLVLLVVRAGYLQVMSSEYLQQQGKARYLRDVYGA